MHSISRAESPLCANARFGRITIRALLDTFLGPLEQVPPVFSAIKINGTPLYERARRGEQFDPPKRPVVIDRLEIVQWKSPVLTVDIDCSKGFYVRSFARDLGLSSGSCAYLSDLIRTRVGHFDLCDAWRLDELVDAPLADQWERIALAPDATALGLPAVILEPGRSSIGNTANAGSSMTLPMSVQFAYMIPPGSGWGSGSSFPSIRAWSFALAK